MSALQQVWGRLQLLFAQGKVTQAGADKVQVRVLDEEVLDNVRRVEPYGFSYRPPGGEAYLVFPAGDRSMGIALIVGDKRYQMNLQAGEVAIHDDAGNHVLLKHGGVVEVKASIKVIADTPLFETTGDARVGGNLVVEGMTESASGFYGTGGGVAVMKGGASIEGAFHVNGRDVGDGHTHISGNAGDRTSAVV